MPGVDDAALHLVGGEAELLQPRVIQQLTGADVYGALSALMTTFKEITSVRAHSDELLPEPLIAQRPLGVDQPPEAGSGDAIIGPPLQPVDRLGPGDEKG